MGGDVILGPMSEERYIYIYRDIYMSFIGGALLSRTEKDIHKISFAAGHTSFLVCRKVCEKISGGHDHVTRVT